jgi:cell division protein FtsN
MAASGTTRSRSGGFFKLYLFVWVIASAAALAYLASLLTGPDLPRALQAQAQGDGEQSTRLASRALSEVGNVRRSVSEIQRDVGLIREGLEQRDSADKQTQSRLSALEERVSSLSTPPVAAVTPPAAPKQKAVEKSEKKAKDKAPERATSRLSRLEGEDEKDPFERPEAEPRVETGSLPAVPTPAPQPPSASAPITFGTPVVTPAKGGTTTYAVQIGAGTSLDALRNSWTQLSNKHAALQGLEARVVAPKAEGGKYRLMAGPFPSKAEAERVCSDMGVGRTGCFSTTFTGEPL